MKRHPSGTQQRAAKRAGRWFWVSCRIDRETGEKVRVQGTFRWSMVGGKPERK